MVFFTDKTNTPYSTSSPLNFLSQKAIDRRAAQNIAVIAEDLPITPAYIQGLKNIGIKVLYKTKWMNGVLVECTASDSQVISGLSFVSSVQYVAPGGRPVSNGRIRSSNKFKDVEQTSATTDMQLSMLAMDKMHSNGFRGQGMLIAIMDGGFQGADTISYFKHVFTEGRFNSNVSYDFVSGGSNVFRHHNHGTNVWSIIAGYKTGVFVGGAYEANFVLFVTEDVGSEYRIEEYNWLFAAERADSLGVDVINTSLGYNTFDDSQMNYTKLQMDGETAVITRATTLAASKGMAVVVSAGNEGAKSWSIITAPADGKNVLAVGAVTSTGLKSSFSSVGPSADGRIKPDVAALGSGVAIVNTNGSVGSGSGTSFAGPLTASLVAGYWQKLRSLSVPALFDTIRKTGTQFSLPDNSLGFGIPSFHYIITSIEEPKNGFLNVYPNPAQTEIILEFTDNQDFDFSVSVVDSHGSVHLIHPNWVEGTKFKVDLSLFPSGVYVLKCTRNRQSSIYKIIKVD